MKKSFVFIVTFLAASVSLAAHAQKESKDFKGVLQCRAIEDSSQRLSCYDNSIPPTRTKSAKNLKVETNALMKNGRGPPDLLRQIFLTNV